METLHFFVTLDNITTETTSNFWPLSHHESLPFPLNAEYHNKVIIIIYLLTNLIFGSILRFNIILFTHSMNGSGNPINLFIWYDQLNGIFMAINIVYTITVLNVPFPLSSIIGDGVCNWADLIGSFYLFGQTVWSCFIAIYRMVYISFQRLFTCGIRTSKFVLGLSWLCHVFVISSAVTAAYCDKGILYKMCTHHSVEEIDILQVS